MNDMVNDNGAGDLAAAQAGDGQAFARLYDRHAAVVLSICRRVAESPTDAEDATQETFIRAHRRLRDLDGSAGLRPWLYAIARRVCAERRRAARRRRHHEATAMRLAPTHPDSAAPDAVVRDEQMSRLTAAIETLSARERLAIHMYYLEHDPVAEARVTLGLSRSGYYKLLARARRNLASIMSEEVARP
ncbi:MAG: sigma-70 family RNA polymerase sigma factor [Phycisphaerales bacterium]|nr:sigma-70 family RNA polymerase sigma factor [Phycisphaerae bacterium]NNF42735.1 sigma-70 family RNA polymerase sigma factor [Phycisphaerales bacterium]NNM25004.1 sigma-70 family RNA polymerase sigma factor [Phycisphaerales bacterium]